MYKQTETPASPLDIYWERTAALYDSMPTVRHRRRWVLSQLQKFLRRTRSTPEKMRLLDYGCGAGQLLQAVSRRFQLPLEQMYGFDPSQVALNQAEMKLPGTQILHSLAELEGQAFKAIICSEVIEHTPAFSEILDWLYHHLETGGVLLLTTQTGALYKADRYAGHTQHFPSSLVRASLEKAGFSVIQERSWGYPFYTLQKFLTELRFDSVRTHFVESKQNFKTRFVFGACYLLYFLHDLISAGPQLYFVATKQGSDSETTFSESSDEPSK